MMFKLDGLRLPLRVTEHMYVRRTNQGTWRVMADQILRQTAFQSQVLASLLTTRHQLGVASYTTYWWSDSSILAVSQCLPTSKNADQNVVPTVLKILNIIESVDFRTSSFGSVLQKYLRHGYTPDFEHTVSTLPPSAEGRD
jgi:hypothetical protein